MGQPKVWQDGTQGAGQAVISPGVLPSLFRLLAEFIPCVLDSLRAVDWGPST